MDWTTASYAARFGWRKPQHERQEQIASDQRTDWRPARARLVPRLPRRSATAGAQSQWWTWTVYS